MQQNTKQNIILTGFMATGKTTIGKMIANELDRKFVDTDALIVEKQGMSIADIFEKFGEDTFRRLETDVAQELAKRDELVISTGGRMMLDPQNVEALTGTGRVFCLVAPPEEILKRLQRDTINKRPLLEVDDPGAKILQLLKERQQGYSRFLQIDTVNKTPEQITGTILELVRKDPA